MIKQSPLVNKMIIWIMQKEECLKTFAFSFIGTDRKKHIVEYLLTRAVDLDNFMVRKAQNGSYHFWNPKNERYILSKDRERVFRINEISIHDEKMRPLEVCTLVGECKNDPELKTKI